MLKVLRNCKTLSFFKLLKSYIKCSFLLLWVILVLYKPAFKWLIFGLVLKASINHLNPSLLTLGASFWMLSEEILMWIRNAFWTIFCNIYQDTNSGLESSSTPSLKNLYQILFLFVDKSNSKKVSSFKKPSSIVYELRLINQLILFWINFVISQTAFTSISFRTCHYLQFIFI